ncbi:MAG: hypothetical protein R3D99_05120 [Altererythrobacter sp.]|jgi:hypothetical protein
MARKKYEPRLAWEAAFLKSFGQLRNFTRAAERAGISPNTVKKYRKRHAAFEAECQRLKSSGPPARPAPTPGQWKKKFLAGLAETSNVSASAESAGIPAREAYQARRSDEAFARKWHAALVEGYEHLEMELLSRLRAGEAKDGPKFDNGAALRLLALHRDTMAQEHAQRRNMDAARARQIIDAKLEELRQKVISRREAEGQTIQ